MRVSAPSTGCKGGHLGYQKQVCLHTHQNWATIALHLQTTPTTRMEKGASSSQHQGRVGPSPSQHRPKPAPLLHSMVPRPGLGLYSPFSSLPRSPPPTRAVSPSPSPTPPPSPPVPRVPLRSSLRRATGPQGRVRRSQRSPGGAPPTPLRRAPQPPSRVPPSPRVPPPPLNGTRGGQWGITPALGVGRGRGSCMGETRQHRSRRVSKDEARELLSCQHHLCAGSRSWNVR